MANVVRKFYRYISASANRKFEEKADPRVQIDQAIEDASRRHEELVSQAALVVGNQKQIEMRMARQVDEVNNLMESARSALMLADNARAVGDLNTASQYEQTAQAFASKLIAAESSLDDMKGLHQQATASAQQARMAVEDNTARMHSQMAERARLLTQIEHAAMQEQMSRAMEGMSALPPPSDTPTLASVRDKVEKKYSVALGRQELASQGLEARMIEVRRATMDAQAAGRIAQLRGTLPAGHGGPAGPSGHAGQVGPGEAAPGLEAGRPAGEERLSLGKSSPAEAADPSRPSNPTPPDSNS